MKKPLFSLALLLAAVIPAKAQFGSSMDRARWAREASYDNMRANGYNVIGFLRSDLGYTFDFEPAYFTAHMPRYDPITTAPIGDSMVRGKMRKAGLNINVETGNFVPLTKPSDSRNSVLAIVYTVMLGFNQYKYQPPESGGEDCSALIMHFAAPIGIGYKTGCAAVLDKSKRFTAGISAGILPSLYIFQDNIDGGVKAKLYPYVSAEAGFFLGLCFKVRGTFAFGKETTLHSYTDPGYNNYSGTISTRPFTTLGIVVMLHSNDWDRDQ